jgi:Protein of unknown function (DUF2815)
MARVCQPAKQKLNSNLEKLMAEYVGNHIILENVRLARLSLTKPYVGKDAKIDPATGKPIGKYHADLIMAIDHPQREAFAALMRAAVKKKFADQAEAALELIKAQDKLALHRGDVSRAGKPEYAGKLYISANNDDQPTIVVTENGVNIANRGTPVILSPSHPQYPYAGCFANVQLNVFAYSHPTGGKGVSAQLMGVQFLRHGERLMGSAVSSAGEFAPVKGADADGAPPATSASTGGDGLI